MKYSSIPAAQTIVHLCKTKNIKNIVISPGSRNAPLIIGFTEDPFFNCYSIVDERCAAFFALGIAQNIREIVAVVCTSGSALLNYYPAVAEAFYSDIPLVIISADRPSYGIDIGDGQTIRQKNVYANHIGYSANLKQDVSHAKVKIKNFGKELIQDRLSIKEIQSKIETFNSIEIQKALRLASVENSPVHINIPFEEPLYDVVDKFSVSTIDLPVDKLEEDVLSEFDEFTKTWNSVKRKMILVGVNAPNTIEQQYFDELAKDPSVLVFTETTSNIHHPNFFSSIDSILAPIEKNKNSKSKFLELQPDILLTFGGLVVSKKIKAFLRQYKPKQHWHVDKKKANDTFFCLSYHFKFSVNLFLDAFLSKTKPIESNYYNHWAGVRKAYVIKREKYLSQIDFSDMAAYEQIFKTIPPNYQVQLSNSSTVRYAQLFKTNKSLQVFCNRGTSGIDGSTSTAIGAALHNNQPTVLITGDLSFLYDSNGLWNKYIKADFRIILMNNSGGGIFRILPGNDDSKNFEEYFETSHNIDASHLCKMHHIEYMTASNFSSLELTLKSFYQKSENTKLLEVKTPRIVNNKVLMGYFDYLSS